MLTHHSRRTMILLLPILLVSCSIKLKHRPEPDHLPVASVDYQDGIDQREAHVLIETQLLALTDAKLKVRGPIDSNTYWDFYMFTREHNLAIGPPAPELKSSKHRNLRPYLNDIQKDANQAWNLLALLRIDKASGCLFINKAQIKLLALKTKQPFQVSEPQMLTKCDATQLNIQP